MGKYIRQIARQIALMALVGGFSACTTNPSTGRPELTVAGKTALKEVAVVGVRNYRRDHPDSVSIERIRQALVELQNLPTITTVSALQAVAQAKINEIDDQFKREDLTSLLRILSPLLAETVGQGELNPDAVVELRDFLGYLVQALQVPQPLRPVSGTGIEGLF